MAAAIPVNRVRKGAAAAGFSPACWGASLEGRPEAGCMIASDAAAVPTIRRLLRGDITRNRRWDMNPGRVARTPVREATSAKQTLPSPAIPAPAAILARPRHQGVPEAISEHPM